MPRAGAWTGHAAKTMAHHEFGGNWTDRKLERVRGYLSAYTRIFAGNVRARKLTAIYVDAFAGTGYRAQRRSAGGRALPFPELADPEAEAFLKGSARLALEVEPPFSEYVFIERGVKRVRELENLKQQFPEKAAAITVVRRDANSYLKEWCRGTDWRLRRAVVFLDPYGMQVEWATIEAVAQTHAIDLWVLFPLGVAVTRLLTRHDPPPAPWSRALTRTLGTEEWRRVFYRTDAQRGLFGSREVHTREADFDKVGRFFVERLKTVFPKVAENPLPLRNSKNIPLYLLCFAVGNPGAASTAIKIAQYILSR